MSAIIVELELVLGFDERGFGPGNPSSDPVAELVDRLVGGVYTVRLKTHLRKAAGVHHEWNLLRRGVDMVVVGKLGCQQELIPVVLFVAREDTNKLFKLLVDVFSLAVGLQVVSSRCSEFNTNEAPQLLSELSNELQAAVGDVLLGGFRGASICSSACHTVLPSLSMQADSCAGM
jgi:hypothetical protein